MDDEEMDAVEKLLWGAPSAEERAQFPEIPGFRNVDLSLGIEMKSRSVQRRLAIQAGLPQPEFDGLARYDDVED